MPWVPRAPSNHRSREARNDKTSAGNSARASRDPGDDYPRAWCVTPGARLDTMEQRLDAVLRAVAIVQPALQKFYGALSDEQKERFGSRSERSE